ncbi:hypothetical protein HKX48_007985 [Thoreauomyces humboldtii]|nr:hypothetical protein HKX48_007985 [Thoreauomyces humboldtii]
MTVQPVRILLTSDVHSKVDNIYRIGMWLQQRHIRPDLTLLCGDLVNANHDYDDFASSIPSFSASSSSPQKISPSLQQAAELKANARRRQEESEFQYVLESFKGFAPRVFYVPGNHDPSEAFPDLHPAPTITEKDFKNEERVAAAPLWQRMDVRTGAKNIHGRLARLGTGLILGGFGGSVPQTVHGTGKPASVHPGYPYDEAAIGTGVSNVLKDKRHMLAIPDVLTSKTRSITGPVTDTHILMTHCGPASLGTTDVNKAPHIPASRLETGSRALSTLLSLPYFQGAVPDAAAYAQLWKEAKTPKKNALSGGLMFHVHGHSHAAWGISHLGSVPVINPGALRDGRFAIATIEWSLNEGLVGGWKLMGVDFGKV